MKGRQFCRLVHVAALAVTATAALAAGDGVTRRAEPKGRLGATITTDDYPDASLRGNEQGMTTVAYEIDETGRVTPGSCVIEATSDFPRLDKQTCLIIEARFRFEPALENGKPVKERRTQSVFWTAPGSRDPERFSDEAVRIIHSQGRCVAGERPQLAQQIIDLPLGSAEQGKLLASLAKIASKCGWRDFRVKSPPTLLIGPMAEAVLAIQFGKSPLPTLPAAAPPLQPRNETEALAHCVVRRNPAHIVELLATTPTGPEESAAIRRIVPDLQPCVTAGTTLRFNRVSMRNLFATALYRDVIHAATSASKAP